MTITGKAARKVVQAASAAKRACAACLRKIFEVDPARCEKCDGAMKLVAMILDDRELDRILPHQGWLAGFPKMKASRAQPGSSERRDENSQSDPRGDWGGRQDFPSEWPA